MAEQEQKTEQHIAVTDLNDPAVNGKIDRDAFKDLLCRMADGLPSPETIMYDVSKQPGVYGYVFDNSYLVTQGNVSLTGEGKPSCQKKVASID